MWRQNGDVAMCARGLIAYEANTTVYLRNLLVFMVLLVAEEAAGQGPAYHHTRVVDPNGSPSANYSTISAAVNSIPRDPTERWTILVYPGVYAEQVTLDRTKENVELIGVSRESVIIDLPGAGAGIIIRSGSETTRNNAIRNLTVVTEDGTGIDVGKHDADAANPSDILIFNVTVRAQRDNVDHGIKLLNTRNAIIEGCDVTATGFGVAVSSSSDIIVQASTFRGGRGGNIINSRNVTAQDCLFLADTDYGPDVVETVGLFVDVISSACLPLAETDGLLAQNCRIEAVRRTSGIDEGLACVRTDMPGRARFVNCDITARSTFNGPGGSPVIGVNCGLGDTYRDLVIIGGSVTTSAAYERETEVWDLFFNDGHECGTTFLVTGTAFSKWNGPIAPAAALRSFAQQMPTVAAPDADGILAPHTLTSSEQEIPPDNQPDVYRLLSATALGSGGALSGMNVFVIGTNWGGDAITDLIVLGADGVVRRGQKPFRTVSKIILPGDPSIEGAQVQVGTTNRLGLYHPIYEPRNVTRLGLRDCDGDEPGLDDHVYATSAIDPDSVDVTYATVGLTAAQLEGGNCIELSVDGVY